MPRNFKEALLFTFLMCGMMVCGMSLWNLLILDWTGVVPLLGVTFSKVIFLDLWLLSYLICFWWDH